MRADPGEALKAPSSGATSPGALRSAAPLFVVGAVSQYLGAALAVGLFDEIAAGSVAWLRLFFAALVIGALSVLRAVGRRSSSTGSVATAPLGGLGGFGRSEKLVMFGFGLALAVMNVSFYLAIDRLPLGTAVAIEFSGPVAVAALASRSTRSWASVVFVVIGVLALADVQWEASPAGVLFALGAATGWAGYIVLGHRVASAGRAGDALVVSFVVAAAVSAPFLLWGAVPAFGSARLLALGAGVGVLSSVVPYLVDQVVMRRTAADGFALLQGVLPIIAFAIGILVLGEAPAGIELVGVSLIVVGIFLRDVSPHKNAEPG